MKGTLGSSCMKNKHGIFEVYTENPDVCQMLILKDVASDKLLARAIVWKPQFMVYNNEQRPLNEVEYFMDRVYSIKDSDVNKFHDFAEKRGWARKTENNYSSHSQVTYKDKDYRIDMEVELGSNHYNHYPYMDTFAEFYGGTLYNNNTSENGGYTLTYSDGGYEDPDGVWSDYLGESIPEDEAVYSHPISSWIRSYNAVEVTTGRSEYQGWYPDEYGYIYFDEKRDEYIHVEDAVYSEFHDCLIYEGDSVKGVWSINSDRTKKNFDYWPIDTESYFYDDDDNLVLFEEIEDQGLYWYNKMKHNWSDDYKGICVEALSIDYKERYILQDFVVTTYGRAQSDLFGEEVEFLTVGDHELINGISNEDDAYDGFEERIEDEFTYMKRVWVDQGRSLSDFEWYQAGYRAAFFANDLRSHAGDIEEFLEQWFEDELSEREPKEEKVEERIILKFNSFNGL